MPIRCRPARYRTRPIETSRSSTSLQVSGSLLSVPLPAQLALAAVERARFTTFKLPTCHRRPATVECQHLTQAVSL